jgi:hypothetical protein
MNLRDHPTIEQFRELLKQADDHAGHHVLWVKKNGDVELTRIPRDKTAKWFERKHPEMQLRYEMFEIGNGYVGPDAVGDDEYLSQLFDHLVNLSTKAAAGQRGASAVISLDSVFDPYYM